MLDRSADLQVTYEGPALDSNEMDARELAPALVAFAELLEEANTIVNGPNTQVRVNVRASFRPGSFGIDFSVVSTVLQSVLDLLNSEHVNGAANLLALLGLNEAKNGLVALLLRLRGGPMQKIEMVNDKTARITLNLTEVIDVDPRVLDLYKSSKVRRAIEDAFVRPLRREGVSRVTTSSGGQRRTVGKEEADYLVAPTPEDELLSDSVTESFLQVVSLSFHADNKWRFTRGQGEGIFYASIADEVFLRRIDRNETTFAKNDILKVLLRTRQVLGETGLRPEYIVEQVLEHRTGARQLKLPLA